MTSIPQPETQTPTPVSVSVEECLRIENDERGLLVGQTRSGKTTLGRVLIKEKQNLVVIDPKRDFVPLQDHVVVYEASELPRAGRHADGRAIVYRPSIHDLAIEKMDVVFQWIFERGNTYTYIDEVTTIIKHAQSYPMYLRAIYTQGRSRGCGILSATQRPSGIPGFCFTESDRFWKFFLSNPADQERMADYMGRIVVELDDYQSDDEGGLHSVTHSFFFYRHGQRGSANFYILER